MNEHIRRVHEQLRCGKCKYSTMSLENLMVHEKVSHPDLPLKNAEYKNNQSADVALSKELSNSEENTTDHLVHEEVGSTPPEINRVDDNIKLEQKISSDNTRDEAESSLPHQQGNYVKPPFSYKQLIIQALMTEKDSGLLLREIYSYITQKYPFYKMEDTGWQNSIRHNLSLIRGFENVSGSHEPGRGGNRWRIRKGYEDRLFNNRWKRRLRPDQGDPLRWVNLENGGKVNVTNGSNITPSNKDPSSFACQKCVFVAFNKPNLDEHTRQVHEHIAYLKCKWCTYSAPRKSVMDNHVEAYHSEKMSSCEEETEQTGSPPPPKVKKESLKVENYVKPKFTYSQLIAQALLTGGDFGLPLRNIYSFINNKYPSYKMSNIGWQNSIRHTLTTNEGFEKVGINTCWRIKKGFEDRVLQRYQKQRKNDEGAIIAFQNDLFREPSLKPDILNATLSILDECKSKYQLDETKANGEVVENLTQESEESLNGHKCFICPFQTRDKEAHKKHLHDVHEVVPIQDKSEEDSTTDDSGIMESDFDPLSTETGGNIPANANTQETLHCIKCSFSTDNGMNEIKDHEKTVHGGILSLPAYKYIIIKCSKCNFSTRNDKGHLRDHEMRVHEGIFYKCDICGKKASRKGSIIEHKRRMHQGVKRFMCTICKHAQYEKKQVVNHVRYVHQEMDDNEKVDSVITKIAGYTSKGQFVEMENSPSFDHQKSMEPDMCQSEYQPDEARTRHSEEASLNPTRKLLDCMICAFTTSSKKVLSLHMINEHKDILEKDVVVPNTCNIETQMEDIDNEDERIGYYKCKMCNYESVWLSFMKRHRRHTHQNFKCSQCSLTSSSAYEIEFHWKINHDTKRDNANITSVAPIPKTDRLKAGKTGVFECIMCSLTTITKESLSEHIIREHREILKEIEVQENEDSMEPQLDSEDESVGYFKCNLCGYASVWMSHLSEHAKQFHQLFKCSNCTFTSSTEIATGNHFRLEHQD